MHRRRRVPRRSRLLVSSKFAAEARQINTDGRAVPDLGLDADLAARLSGKSVDHAQSKTGAFTRRLGGEEGFKGSRDHVGRHANAGIAYAKRQELSFRHIVLSRRPRIEPFVGGLDGDLPPLGTASRALRQRLSSEFSSCE
jgi:hypothetical protein